MNRPPEFSESPEIDVTGLTCAGLILAAAMCLMYYYWTEVRGVISMGSYEELKNEGKQ